MVSFCSVSLLCSLSPIYGSWCQLCWAKPYSNLTLPVYNDPRTSLLNYSCQGKTTACPPISTLSLWKFVPQQAFLNVLLPSWGNQQLPPPLGPQSAKHASVWGDLSRPALCCLPSGARGGQSAAAEEPASWLRLGCFTSHVSRQYPRNVALCSCWRFFTTHDVTALLHMCIRGTPGSTVQNSQMKQWRCHISATLQASQNPYTRDTNGIH